MTESRKEIDRITGAVSDQTTLIHQIEEGLTITEENFSKTVTEIDTQSSIIQQIITALEGKAGGGGAVLPTLENPGSAADLAEGKQLIGVDGSVVTGSLIETDNIYFADDPYAVTYRNEIFHFESIPANGRWIVDNPVITGFAYGETFGDAKPEDVAQGKTFSSVNGLKITGTATSGGASVKTATARPSSNSTSISFTGLTAQPKMFAVCPTDKVTFNAQNHFIVNVMYDGTTTRGIYAVGSGSWNATYTGTHSATYFSWTYNNGTLTVKSSSNTNGGYFASGVTYQLTYVA